MKSNAGQPLDPLGIGIFGHQLGPFPDPAEFVQPASHGLRKHHMALLGGQLRGQHPILVGGLTQGAGTACIYDAIDTECKRNKTAVIAIEVCPAAHINSKRNVRRQPYQGRRSATSI